MIIQDIQDEIEMLILTAETGAQWAEICLLEKKMLELQAAK